MVYNWLLRQHFSAYPCSPTVGSPYITKPSSQVNRDKQRSQAWKTQSQIDLDWLEERAPFIRVIYYLQMKKTTDND